MGEQGRAKKKPEQKKYIARSYALADGIIDHNKQADRLERTGLIRCVDQWYIVKSKATLGKARQNELKKGKLYREH